MVIKFNIPEGDELGDHDDQVAFARWDGYLAGVSRVLEYIESINRYKALENELYWAIDERII